MTTQQINIRLETALAAALDRVAREESLDRATAIRRLLETSIKQWELDRAVLAYQRGELSLGRAAEEAGLSQWELTDTLRVAGVAHPLTGDEARRRLARLAGEPVETLPDIPPAPGGVLLVGINPAPISVAAGHYYQGRLGRRLWRRLEALGLLQDPVPGAEDDAFAAEGHGLTDLVKRPTPSSDLLSERELAEGTEVLREKIRGWNPGLLLCAFKAPAARLIDRNVAPGLAGEVEGVPLFLLSGPYAPRAEAERIDAELKQLLSTQVPPSDASTERTQTITAADLERGQIRLPRDAKRLFPSEKGSVEIVLRGTRIEASYDPRLGPDRERSAVLRIGRDRLTRLVRQGEALTVSRGLGGVVQLG
jgi:double-stranded uracil-DNA glycosylase